ncbi:hypothetical protein [Kribbella sp. NPDC049227]|uniref:hypothetical protein n=1 Tax=Kribbella sp. NPDC049227 TaxID=3364113 RepID=UPI003715430F
MIATVLRSAGLQGFVFFVNQQLTLGQRNSLRTLGSIVVTSLRESQFGNGPRPGKLCDSDSSDVKRV